MESPKRSVFFQSLLEMVGMRVETQNSTFHGMSLHESGVKEAEGEKNEKRRGSG